MVSEEDEEEDIQERKQERVPKPPAQKPPAQRPRRRNQAGRPPRHGSQSTAPTTEVTAKPKPAPGNVTSAAYTAPGKSPRNSVTSERSAKDPPSSMRREGDRSNGDVSHEELQLRLELQTAGMRLLATGRGNKAVSAAACRIL